MAEALDRHPLDLAACLRVVGVEQSPPLPVEADSCFQLLPLHVHCRTQPATAVEIVNREGGRCAEAMHHARHEHPLLIPEREHPQGVRGGRLDGARVGGLFYEGRHEVAVEAADEIPHGGDVGAMAIDAPAIACAGEKEDTLPATGPVGTEHQLVAG